MSLSIICNERLKPEDVIILGNKNIGISEVIPVVYLPDNIDMKKRFSFSRRFDHLVSEKTSGEEYIAYIPSMGHIARLLVTNEKCRGFNVFEEGAAAYHHDMTISEICCEYSNQQWRCNSIKSKITVLKNVLTLIIQGIPLRVLSLPIQIVLYSPLSNITFYASNKKAFASAQNRKVINIENELTRQIVSHFDLSNSYIWVSSEIIRDHYQYRDKIRENYTILLKKVFDRSGVNHIYVKFHQNESEESRKWTLAMLSEIGLEETVLPDGLIMEIQLMKDRNITMIGDMSSLLLYNSIYGHKSISLIKSISCLAHIPESSYSMIEAEFLEF